MERLIMRYAYRIPELLMKALTGDVFAIAILAAMVIGTIITSVRKK